MEPNKATAEKCGPFPVYSSSALEVGHLQKASDLFFKQLEGRKLNCYRESAEHLRHTLDEHIVPGVAASVATLGSHARCLCWSGENIGILRQVSLLVRGNIDISCPGVSAGQGENIEISRQVSLLVRGKY